MATDSPIEEALKQAQLDARALARKLRRQARRPFVLEITGTPKAGKTTLIGMLESFLRDCGWKVHVLKERAGECPLPNKGHFFFNTWTMGTMLAGLLDAVDRDFDLVILDRGIFDSLVWLEMQVANGQVSDGERIAFEGFVTLERWRRLVDAVCLIEVDPNIAMQRENASRLLPRTGSVMNEVRLRQFNSALAKRMRANADFEYLRIDNALGAKQGALALITSALDRAGSWCDPEIAVLARDAAEALIPTPTIGWSANLLEQLVARVQFRTRSEIESDDNWVQLLACGAQVHAGEVFLVVRRPRRDDVPRPRDNSAMLWRGCHVKKPSDGQLRVANLEEQLMERLRNDLHLGHLDATPEPKGIVWTRDGDERRHLGLVFKVAVPDNVAEFLDEKEFKTNGRGHSLQSSFVRPDELPGDSGDQKSYTLEEWSRLFLTEKWLP